MRLLLIDTCGTESSAALADTALSSPIVMAESLPGRSASEQLIPSIRVMMSAQGWQLRDLAAIAVVHGPGSFTGVRVGLSAAKGISEASEVPLVAISRLAVLTAEDGKAALDAGRNEFYVGEYHEGRCIQEALLSRDELIAAIGAEILVVCETKVEDALTGLLSLRRVAEPAAADALTIAAARASAKEWDDAATLDANYLRRTDAQLFAWARPTQGTAE